MAKKKPIITADQIEKNAALAFIADGIPPSTPTDKEEAAQHTEAAAEPAAREAVPEGYRLDPRFIEKRTKRVQVVLMPSIYRRAKACAEARGVSMNEFIHLALENLIDKDEKGEKL